MPLPTCHTDRILGTEYTQTTTTTTTTTTITAITTITTITTITKTTTTTTTTTTTLAHSLPRHQGAGAAPEDAGHGREGREYQGVGVMSRSDPVPLTI